MYLQTSSLVRFFESCRERTLQFFGIRQGINNYITEITVNNYIIEGVIIDSDLYSI